MLEVVPLQAFKDNYIWTLRNATHAAVVDPGESGPVFEYLVREIRQLRGVKAGALEDGLGLLSGGDRELR